uniref:Uncharacterized protein n=1 Tax=Rhizophora mucronata TaxID=61149 RepID=A0A2P2NMI5_RHIMU
MLKQGNILQNTFGILDDYASIRIPHGSLHSVDGIEL